jgi:putative nucleotidyltransferase with HDIG domain
VATMRLVPIEAVKVGSYLARTLFDDSGRILLREGIQLSEMFILKIKSIKIYSIYIVDEYSVAEIEDVIKPELRQKAVRTIKDTFHSLENFSINSSASKQDTKKANNLLKERAATFQSISSIAADLMDELLDKRNLLINLVDIKSMDNYTYQHSVNVAVLSLILGLQLNLNRYDLYELCVGALLHDIGKMLIPKELILKPGKLTDEEFNTIKNHALMGYDYLKGIPEISSHARVIALQHHEKYDGNGYPEKRAASEITLLARIVSIADVYDALTSDRPYRRAMSPNDALEYIMGIGSTQFDFKLVKAFAKIIVPYPEGTIIKLSNGDYAVVEEVFPNYPLRPMVKIVKSTDKSKENSSVNLLTALDLVILGIEYDVPC